MASKFQRERSHVERLMQRLAVSVDQYHDPNVQAGRETGIDVLAITVTGERIGVQVTELDTGSTSGQSRAHEKGIERDALREGLQTYGASAQNSESMLVQAIKRSIETKSNISKRHTFEDLTKVWLLVIAGLPEQGAAVSTLAVTPGLHAETLTNETLADLQTSNFHSAFLYPIHGVEHAFYQWHRNGSWKKSVMLEMSNDRRNFSPDVLQDERWVPSNLDPTRLDLPSLLEQLERTTDDEVKKVRREIRSK